MPLIKRENFYLNFAFRIEEAGFAVSYFKTVSKIKIGNEIIRYQEGGSLLDYLTLGRAKIDDITLTRGVNVNRDLLTWMDGATNSLADVGGGDEQKRTLDLVQQDRAKGDIARFRLHECLPGEYSLGDWDNSGNDVLMEEMVIAVTAISEIPL